MTPEEFAKDYEASRRTLWFIAVAILGDRTQAYDVVQEAATIAMAKLGEFDRGTNFVAWMSQIVRFVALNEARSRQRRKAAAVAEALANGAHGTRHGDEASAPPNDPLDARVSAGLGSLDETARACLLLRVVHGMAYSEIAKALKIPEGTAMSHVHRSRMALRERLGTDERGPA